MLGRVDPDLTAKSSARPGTDPRRKARPFSADYGEEDVRHLKKGQRLPLTIDGDEIIAPQSRIAGRRVVGGRDRSLDLSAIEGAIEDATGNPVRYWPDEEFAKGDAGYTRPRADGSPRYVAIRDSLDFRGRVRTARHELGHVVDLIAKTVDVTGIEDEARRFYHLIAKGRSPRGGKVHGPIDEGYLPDREREELVAEGVGAYAVAANLIKTEAPNLAERIRIASNRHPLLRRILAFNSFAPAMIAGREAVRAATGDGKKKEGL